ncbi:MAG: YaiO family outer membrane beta-barrel protein, partial [Chitinophagaceae bacterium]
KAKILEDLKKYSQAYSIADSILIKNPKNDQARAFASSIQGEARKNQLGMSYDYNYFDKNYPSSTPWQMVGLSYIRETKFGSVIARINYANRFKKNGLQAEVDAYPHLSKTFYAYLNFGYSGNLPVFPTYRAGFSLYASLPRGFEGELGFRYLYFSNSTLFYTASVGKYYKNYWFNFRTYLIPDRQNISQSYNLTARYYFGGTDDYWTIGLGTGISPDDRSASILLNTKKKLLAKTLLLGYRRTLHQLNILYFNLNYINEEIQPGLNGNQIDLEIGYLRKF